MEGLLCTTRWEHMIPVLMMVSDVWTCSSCQLRVMQNLLAKTRSGKQFPTQAGDSQIGFTICWLFGLACNLCSLAKQSMEWKFNWHLHLRMSRTLTSSWRPHMAMGRRAREVQLHHVLFPATRRCPFISDHGDRKWVNTHTHTSTGNAGWMGFADHFEVIFFLHRLFIFHGILPFGVGIPLDRWLDMIGPYWISMKTSSKYPDTCLGSA